MIRDVGFRRDTGGAGRVGRQGLTRQVESFFSLVGEGGLPLNGATRLLDRSPADLALVAFCGVDSEMSVEAVRDVVRGRMLEHAVVLGPEGWLGVVDRSELRASLAREGRTRPVRHLVTATPCVSADVRTVDLSRAILSSRNHAVMIMNDDGRLQGVVAAGGSRHCNVTWAGSFFPLDGVFLPWRVPASGDGVGTRHHGRWR